MLNRQNEAKKAIEFAREVLKAYNNEPGAESILSVIQSWRANEELAVVPSEAENVDQIYADMIAEHFVRNPPETEIDLKKLDEAAKAAFEKLLTEDYKDHQKGVYETYLAISAFRQAIRAYALLKPGGKGEPDAAPEDSEIRKAMEDAAKTNLRMTLDVFSNQISPLERYARARSKIMPDGTIPEESTDADDAPEWRIPRKFCSGDASAAEIVLLAILYYRHRPAACTDYTDYYPIPSNREVGIYMSDRNQGKPFGKKKDMVYLKVQSIVFPGNHTRTMVAMKQEAVEAFAGCNTESAEEAKFFVVKAGKPRDLLKAVEAEIPKKEETKKAVDAVSYEDYMKTVFNTNNQEKWVGWVAVNGKTVLEQLKAQLDFECKANIIKGEGPKAMKVYSNKSGKWVLKFLLCVHWLEMDEKKRKEEQRVSFSDLEKLLDGEEKVVFERLEKTKWQVLNAGEVYKGEDQEYDIPTSDLGVLKYDVEGDTKENRTFIYSIWRKNQGKKKTLSKASKGV